MTALETWLDGAVGETRLALVQAGRPVALRSWRWSEEGRRARHGELYAARVIKVDRARRGAFLDLGLSEETGFLPLDSQGRARPRVGAPKALREGGRIAAEVTREAARGKGPVLVLLEERAETPGRLQPAEADALLREAAPARSEVRRALDEAFEAAAARLAPLPGGGVLSIEPTSALTAIDVDAGGREPKGDSDRFVRELNLAAAAEAMRQLRLRNLGGLVVIDFVSMRRQEDRRAVEVALREAAKADPWGAQIAPMSRFGLIELSRPQTLRPVAETLLGQDGEPTIETTALLALRELEREAAAGRGRPVILRAHPSVIAWLQGQTIHWREALSRRIGARFTLEAAPELRSARIDVRLG